MYRREGVEHRAQLVDIASTAERRATVILERARAGTSFSLDDADAALARPDSGGRPTALRELRMATAVSLWSTLPARRWTERCRPSGSVERNAAPGEFIVVYARQPDGRVADILVGIGNDPATLLALLARDR